MAQERKVLAKHSTIATYTGTADQPCHFRTALCPDRCGHAAKVASFHIESYESYEKVGEYGDDKKDIFHVRVSGGAGDVASEEVKKTIEGLNIGDKVKLDWDHEYVTATDESGSQSSFPERPVKKLEPLDATPPDAVATRTSEVLSKHSTLATYAGTAEQPCRFLTSLCPDRCGHASTVATFRIVRYLGYEKPGQYGDEQKDVFHVRVSGGRTHGGDTATPEVAALIATLASGDKVLLDWEHLYVTAKYANGGEAKFPERPVTKLERADPTAAAAIVSQTRELLARNATIATFEGTQVNPCRFLTSECPDRCGHASTVARFHIEEYLVYEKPGQYGDEKSDVHYVRIAGGRGAKEASDEIVKAIEGLKAGDKVKLFWDHEYVTTNYANGGQAKFPERPVRKLEPLEESGKEEPGTTETRELLSRHSTIATYAGTEEQRCRFRTALCPDKCGHGSTVARFDIVEYLAYEQPASDKPVTTDGRKTVFHVRVKGGRGGDIASEAVKTTIEGLKVGDKVKLDWDHEYVTATAANGTASKFPERPVRKLELA